MLGILWNLLGPMLTLLVLFLVFRRHFEHRVDAYPVYLLTGIVVVGFFIGSTQLLVTVFERTRDIIQNTLVPTEIGLAANLAPFWVRLGTEVILCLILSLFYGGIGWLSIPMLLPILVSLVSLSLGVGLMLGVLYTYTQDVEQIWMVVARLFFFVTPVFYDITSLSRTAQELVYWCNPLTPVLMAMRMCVIPGQEVVMGTWIHGALVGPLALIVGYGFYLAVEGRVMENA
jgi:ABC-type polysaccharide/polyol phosphate export permease